ncbi:histidine kinase [Brevibacillus borstelensis]|nr:histidine kinase [Brevibacillus borstelensis]
MSEASTFRELALLCGELLETSRLEGIRRAAELAPFAVLVNLIHERLIRQGVLLAVRQLAKMGVGTPPVPFAYLQFGSGGRCEQAVASDQDNGLVYQLPHGLSTKERENIEGYFHLLGAVIVQGLEQVGYPPCHGNVTCVSARWRGSTEQWMERLEHWASHPTWEHSRYLLLFSDARVIWGEPSAFATVAGYYRTLLTNNPLLIERLVSNTLYHRIPLTWLGRLAPDQSGRYQGAVNVKEGVYLPFVNCVRHFSLAHGIYVTSTLERLLALRTRRIWPEAFCRDIEQHFRLLMGLRLITPLHWRDGQYGSNSYVKLGELSQDTLAMLRRAMKLALKLHGKTKNLLDVYRQ